jgi:hypothetical protein
MFPGGHPGSGWTALSLSAFPHRDRPRVVRQRRRSERRRAHGHSVGAGGRLQTVRKWLWMRGPAHILVESLQHYVMTYTAFSRRGPRIAIAISDDLLHWRRIGLASSTPSSIQSTLLPLDHPRFGHGRRAVAAARRRRRLSARQPNNRGSHEVRTQLDSDNPDPGSGCGAALSSPTRW